MIPNADYLPSFPACGFISLLKPSSRFIFRVNHRAGALRRLHREPRRVFSNWSSSGSKLTSLPFSFAECLLECPAKCPVELTFSCRWLTGLSASSCRGESADNHRWSLQIPRCVSRRFTGVPGEDGKVVSFLALGWQTVVAVFWVWIYL